MSIHPMSQTAEIPSLVVPDAPQYDLAPRTQADLVYADLPIIDLEKAKTLEGRLMLAVQVRDAMQEHGFFCVINHGYTAAQTQRVFDIADIPFTRVDDVEKQEYVAKMEKDGSSQGYKLRHYWHINNDVLDEIERYSINRDVTMHQHPEPLRPFLPEIGAFTRHNDENVLHPILRLLALGLELPEETLVNLHNFSVTGETSVHFMKYYPRSNKGDELKAKNVWLKGHTDIGTITILYSQPIAGLQILARDGTWKFVKHIENGLVINAGDALEFLSGGFYRATIHRVVQPPPDQRSYTRLGVFYFSLTDDSVQLKPLLRVESPVLQRAEISQRFEESKPLTMEAWRKGRTVTYGRSKLKTAANGVEEELIHGVVVKHYN